MGLVEPLVQALKLNHEKELVANILETLKVLLNLDSQFPDIFSGMDSFTFTFEACDGMEILSTL